MRDTDTKFLEEAYETMTQEAKRKFKYVDKGKPGYYCKLCVHYKKNVKSPRGDEFYCDKLKQFVNPNGLCLEYKTSSQVRRKTAITKAPNTPNSAPADSRSPATRGNDMHSDPQVSQTPV